MPVFLARGKYYTRIRWGNDKTFRGDVKLPLDTTDKLVAEHRRDIIQDSSLRGKIISAYEKDALDGVRKIRDQVDWFSRSATLVESSITLSQAISEYNDYCIGQRLNNSTIEIYLRTLDEFAEITKVKRIDRIKKMHFTMFKNKMVHLSKHTVNRKLRSLQTFFNWMHDEGTIESPLKIKKLPVISPAVNFFSNKEFNIILQNVKKGFPYGEARMQDNDQDLFISSYWLYRDTGLRLSEPFNNELKIGGSDYRLKIIGSTTKNSYERFVYLTEQQAMTIIQLNEWVDRQLKTRESRELTIKVLSRVFKQALRRSRIEGKFHDLRKTFASRLYFLTGEEFTLCRALGHTTTSMAMQYTNLDKVELAKAFPDIVAMKNANSGVKEPVRGHNQGDTELYSNFGFMHVT